MLTTDALANLFQKSTHLTFQEITEIVDLISNYEEADDIAYEIIGQLDANISFENVKQDLVSKKFEWNAAIFKDLRKETERQDSILERPPELREGELECPKCHTKKTLVVEMQTRSADEGCTYYIYCLDPKCKKITKT